MLSIHPFAYAAFWVMSSVAIGMLTGYAMGTGTRKKVERKAEAARQASLTPLLEILQVMEQLKSEVGTHNTEIREVGVQVGHLNVSGELDEIKHAILNQVTSILKSNQKLEDDLVCARYHLEEQAQEIDRTRREARTDVVSGVANRKGFDESLQWLLAHSHRSGDPFTLILADMDRFKWINDTHGHQTGDQVLERMGALLKSSLRNEDIVARYGGDEFGILLPRTDYETGAKIAARLRAEIYRSTFPVGTRGEQGVVSLSLGVTTVLEGDTVESIIHRADRALYKSKEMGRNRVSACTSEKQEVEPVELVA
jgi:diguanylate cyclase